MNYNYSSKTNPTVDKAVVSRISVGVESLKLQLELLVCKCWKYYLIFNDQFAILTIAN